MNLLPGILVSLLFSALFSGLEIAFVSSDKLQIELLNRQQNPAGKILSYFLRYKSKFIATLLVGNTIALVVYGIYMTQLLEPVLLDTLPAFFTKRVSLLIIETLLSTILVLLTAEFLPKSIFLINPDKLLSIFSYPLVIIYGLLYPFVAVIVWLSKLVIVYVLKKKYEEDKPVFDYKDLRNYLKGFTELPDEDEEVDTKILKNAVDFKNLQVRDCMVPRTDLIAIDKTQSIDELKDLFMSSGFSKILVYDENIDNIVGFVHHSTLFKKPKDLTNITKPISIVPETMAAQDLLVMFTNDYKSIAVVVDEFGGTSGIVTLEDVIEEIFGEIEDETDETPFTEVQESEKVWLLSARLEIDYLNQKYGWMLPEGEYETLSGFILYLYEDLPEIGDRIESAPFTLEVVEKENNRIDLVRFYIGDPPEQITDDESSASNKKD